MYAPERRLTAILCADVVGYSRLMRQDETGTLARLDEARAMLCAATDEHGGRVFNLAGDGLLAEFPSALAGVQAALAAQERLALWAAAQPEQSRMRLRIGVNLGDVVVSGEDLLGDGVNVAARLQALAEPGGVCLSAAVHDQVRGRIPANFTELEHRPMKNIAEPIRVYAFRPEGAVPSTIGHRLSPRISRFLFRVIGALILLAVMLAINLMTTPHRIWVQWPALGFAAALLLPVLREHFWDRPTRDRAG